MSIRRQLLSGLNHTIRFTGFQVARQELIIDPAQVQAQSEEPEQPQGETTEPVQSQEIEQAQIEVIEQSESQATEINEILLRPSFNQKPLPPEAEAYLQHDNPKLIELEEAYKHSPPP